MKVYIQKLAGISPEFRVELERYAPTQNPASLGLIERDELYVWGSMPITGVSSEDQNNYGDGCYGHEAGMSQRLGYFLPLGDRFGLAAEIISSHQDNSINFPSAVDFLGNSTTHLAAAPSNIGGSVGLGWRVSERLSVGAALHVYNTGNLLSNLDSAGDTIAGNYVAADAGVLIQAIQDRLLLDLHAVYTTQQEYYYDQARPASPRAACR